jgi:hypothetical protein
VSPGGEINKKDEQLGAPPRVRRLPVPRLGAGPRIIAPSKCGESSGSVRSCRTPLKGKCSTVRLHVSTIGIVVGNPTNTDAVRARMTPSANSAHREARSCRSRRTATQIFSSHSAGTSTLQACWCRSPLTKRKIQRSFRGDRGGKGGQCEGSQIPRTGYPGRDHDADPGAGRSVDRLGGFDRGTGRAGL